MKNILFCTVDSWSTDVSTSSSNTYINLFENYPVESKAALFLREEFPNSKSCCKYFQISEQRVIKSLYSRVKTGKVIDSSSAPTSHDSRELAKSKLIYAKHRKRNPFMLMLREIIWFLGRWRTKELRSFLKDFNPDVVLFSFEGYIHFNRICRYIIKHTKAKAIGYIWDDTFTYKSIPNKLGYKVLRYFQRKSLRKTAELCSAYWAISPKTKYEADIFFNIDSTVITKPVDLLDIKEDNSVPDFPIHMLYTGNLGVGRFDSLVLLSDTLSVINAHETKIYVDVYTNTFLDTSQLSLLHYSVRVHPPVKYSEVLKLQKSTDVLLYLESLSEVEKNKARLSFSTKITDYLAACKPIIAIGPNDVAAMEYLYTNNVALCASSVKELQCLLESVLRDPLPLNEVRKNAIKCGQTYHARSIIQEKIDNCLQSL